MKASYLGLILAATVLFGIVAVANAEGPIRQTAGPYEIIAGYAVDPPYMEEGNALVLQVRDTRTGEPVPGLENTLTVQGTVTILETAKTYPVPLRPALNQPGVYEGVFVPPAVGKYAFNVAGFIEGTRVAAQFTSGEGGLPEVVHRTQGKYNNTGVYLAVAIALAYVVGLAVLLGIAGARKLRRAPRTA